MSFQAKIKLGNIKSGPLTHTGFRGRVIRKGESFASTSQEEAAYYQAQPGFSVTVIKGKLPKKVEEPEEEVDETDETVEESDDEQESAATGAYEKADLKKMSREDLIALVKSDESLPLKARDIPKKAGKKEIIGLILDAQSDATTDDDEEED